MASALDDFDAVKVRHEIFQPRKRNIWTTIQFVAETIRILGIKRRKNDFLFLADKSIQILQGNFMLKKLILHGIVKCNKEDECTHMLKYYLEFEKTLNGSVTEKKMRMVILLKIAQAYHSTSDYRKTLEYAKNAESIAREFKDKSWKFACYQMFAHAYLSLSDYKKAIDYYQKGLEISTEIGGHSGIANSNVNLGKVYFKLGEYEKAIDYYQKGLEISIAIGDRSGISCTNGNLGEAHHSLGEYEKAIDYYQKGLELSTAIGDRSVIASFNGNLGNVYHRLGEYVKAIDYYQKGLEISTAIGDRSGKAGNYGNLGNAYLGLGEYEKAIDYYQKCLEINRALGDRSGIATNIGNLGNAYQNLGEIEKAIDYYQKGLEISTAIGDRSGIASKNGNLGNAYYNLGQYEKAIDYYQKSLEINSAIRDRSGIATDFGNLGNVYCNLGVYEKAIDYYQKSLEINSAIGDRSGIATINGNLGNAYLSLGEYEKAIVYYKKGLEINSEIGDQSVIATNIGNLGSAYFRLGQYVKAIDYYQKGLEISTAIGYRSEIACNNGNLGNAYRSLGEYVKAIDYYQKGLEIYTTIGNQLGIARHNRNLGNAYLSLGENGKAIDYYQKGLEISTVIGDQSGIANSNGNLGNAYLSLGEYGKAIDYCQKGLEISTAIGDRLEIANNNGNLGWTHFLLGRSEIDNQKSLSIVEVAVVYIKESVKCGDQLFLALDVDQNKISFTKELFRHYVTLMCCFIFLKRIQAALLVIDVGKAKALHAFLEKRRKQVVEKRKKPGRDAVVDYTCKILERIDSNEEKMETEEIQKTLKLQTSNSSVLFYSFDHDKFLNIWILNGKNGVRHIIWRESEEMNSVEDYIYEKLAKLLKSFSVELKRYSSFCELESDSTPGEQVNVSARLGRKSVNEKSVADLDKTKIMPSQKHPSGGSTPEPDISATNILRKLFQVLIEPVKDLIKGDKLIIVPDKFLFFVPFCSLLDENDCRLSEHFSVHITPSLHTLVSSMTQSRDRSLGFALFVGNPTLREISFRGQPIVPVPLENAKEEVECLAPLFGAQPLIESEATKERVLKFIQGASVIHIAAHGEPNHGEIMLSPNPNATERSSSLPKEDSYLLKQQDIMKISIKARFVVLSCCHTGRGKVSSEGVVGLTRAFLAAGARSVLATLWPIDDKGTKEFMKVFYDYICQGISICEALRRTMNIFQRHENQEFRAFGIWAPFTIYGEDVKFTKDDIEEIKQKSRKMSF